MHVAGTISDQQTTLLTAVPDWLASRSGVCVPLFELAGTPDFLAYLAQNIEDAFQEKKKVLAIFFDLSNAFDKVWKERLLVKLLRTSVRCKMYMKIQHFLFAGTA